jgi:hypothetical protein
MALKKPDMYVTRHAKRRMKWRGVSLQEVEEVVARPDRIERRLYGGTNAFKSLGKKAIRVSYIQEGNRLIVISVVDKNR